MEFLDRLRAWSEQIPLQHELYGNELQQWLAALAVFAGVFMALRLTKAFIGLRASRIAQRRQSDWARVAAELVAATKLWFLFGVAAYCASLFLILPPRTGTAIEVASKILVLLQAAVWGTVLLSFAIGRYMKQKMEADAAAVTTISALGFVGKIVLWAIVAMLALQNLGVEVTALVAGLGVGGIAVALAAQNILGDLFASMSIVLDKPFVLGDFIIVDDKMGTVANIGLKTTRLQSLGGEQLIFANSDLLNSRIRNMKRMQERRVLFSVGVTYDTPREKLEQIPAILRDAIEAQRETRFDRAHFKAFGPSSLDFEVVYYVLQPQYNLYMDIQQAVNLIIFDRFAAEDVEFAFPTQTVYVRR